MSRTVVVGHETIKYLSDEEAARAGRRVITTKDAKAAPLPAHCSVIDVKVLEKPRPIKRRKKGNR